MKTKKRLTAFMMSLILLVTLVMPTSGTKVFAEDNDEVNVVTQGVNADGKTTTIQVLSTTDLHGKFKNYDYPTDSLAAGGLNQVSEVVKAAKIANPNTLVVDNGDAVQGNYNHLFTTNEYASVNPMGLAFNTIGYDAISLGNHEFNFGMDYLKKYEAQVEAAGTDVICANLYKGENRVFSPYTIKTVAGVKVAIIGVVSPHITKWDGDKLVGYTPTDPAKEVQKVITDLKAKELADVFVVTAHVGLTEEYGTGDSATDIANLNPEVAMIVAGHSHVTNESVVVNGVLITQPAIYGGGVSNATLNVTKDASGTVTSVTTSAKLEALTKTSPEDAALNVALKPYHDAALADAHSIVGKLVNGDLASANELKDVPQSFIQDEGITDLINEVQLNYSKNQLKALDIDTSKIHHVSSAAMLSATANMKAGNITKAGVATIYKYDNTLYTVKTTGKQLKNYMEWSAQYYNTFKNGDFNVSFKGNIAAYNYDLFTGVNYEINISKDTGSRIEKLTYSDGTAVKDTDEIYLSVNNYRYSSKLTQGIFDKDSYTLVCTSANDEIYAIRDMITDYIINNKKGTIERIVDNNWKLTGVTYNEKLRAEVVKLINDGTLTLNPNNSDKYGVTSTSLRWSDVEAQLTAKGETQKLASLQKLFTKNVDVLSFNDFHGNVLESGKNIGAAKLAGVINGYESKESEVYSAFAVSAGDLYQGTAISNVKFGKPVSDMLKNVDFEASALGNHEFDWKTDKINTWAKDGDFDFLAANVVKKGTEEIVDYVKPYKIVEQNGAKIALIGIATPDTATAALAENVKDVDFLDPVKTVTKWTKVVRETENADAVVVIAHSAAYQDAKTKVITGEAAEIAKVYGVDAVIAGHNHATVSGKVGNVPVVEGGYNARALAKLSFTFDYNNNLVSVEPSVQSFLGIEKTLPIDSTVDALMKAHNEELAPMMSEVVTTLPERLSHDDKNTGVTPLGVVVTETMRKIAGTQIGLTNGGGVRRSLEQGNVTVGDMYEILPFDNTLVTLDVKGSDLYTIIEHGINTKGFAWGQYAGIKVWYNAETGKVSSIRLNDGTKIDMDKYYSVVINDFMLTGGDGYDFSNAKNAVNTNIVMRDAMAADWKTNGVPKVAYDILVAGVDTTVDKPADPKPATETKTDKPGKLPKTGVPFTPDMFATMGVLGIALGGYLAVKKKKSA